MTKTVFAALVAAVCVQGASGARNLVRNAGFELPGPDGEGAADWSAPKDPFSYVSGEGYNGSRAMKMELKEDSPYRYPVQNLDLVPGKTYRATVRVRTEKLVGTGTGACLALEWFDRNGKWLKGAYSRGAKGTTGDWDGLRVLAVVPTNAARTSVVLYVPKKRTGIAWFDDVCVEADEKPLLGKLHSNVYRNTADTGKVTFRSFTGIGDEEASKRGLKGEFSVPDVSGKPRKTAVAVSRGCFETTVDVESLPEGRSETVLCVKDRDGKVLASESIRFNRSGEAKDWRVSLDRHNRVLVEGKPFYPLGVFVSNLGEPTLSALKGGPFNCVLTYGQPTVKRLDAFHEAGIKVIVNLKDLHRGMRWCPKAITNAASEVKWVTDYVNRFKNHPAVLAWYVNDESGPEWVDVISERRALLRRIDPHHPTYMCVYQVKQLRDYLGSFDICGTDSYPIGHPMNSKLRISRIGEITKDTRNAFFGEKPFWQVPQIFDWGGVFKDRASVTRAPTEAEMKNMAWQCVVEGATGVLAWSYSSLAKMNWRDPADVQWAKVCRVYGHIAEHLDVLLSTDRAPAVSGMPEGVGARTWRHAGKDWLLVVNTRREPVEFEVDVEGRGRIPVRLDAIGVEMRRL